MTNTAINPETAVLAGDPQAVYCPYCEQPFDTEQTRALHVGEVHPNRVTDADRAAYEEATAAEDDELWVYQMKTVVGLTVLYGVIISIYMIALG